MFFCAFCIVYHCLITCYFNPKSSLYTQISIWIPHDFQSRTSFLPLTNIQSSTCVPNPSAKYPLLAPIDYPDICPLGAKERWELRARGLGCNVSTRNFLSVVVAVISSFVLVGLIALVFYVLSKMIGWCMERRSRSRDRRGGRRNHLGIIFYRGMDGDRVDIIEEETGHGRAGRMSQDGVSIDETSPLLRSNNQGINV